MPSELAGVWSKGESNNCCADFQGSNLSDAREQRDANGTCLGLVTAEAARMTASDPEADLDLGWQRIEVSYSVRASAVAFSWALGSEIVINSRGRRCWASKPLNGKVHPSGKKLPSYGGHEVTHDHFDSVINRDQTCKLGIEWDLCAPGLLCCVASEQSSLHSATIFQRSRLLTRTRQSWSFSPRAHIAL